MITLAIALVVGFVIVSASGQNSLEVESSTKLAETALTVKKREIGRNLKDYAVWEDAYRNLHADLDFEWASTDGNVGANIFEGLGYEMAFVVAPDGRTVYAVIEGVPQQADASRFFPDGLDGLLRVGREGSSPAVGLLRTESDVMLVAATAILPPSIEPSSLPPAERSVLIFAKRIDPPFLQRMSNEYLLERIALVPDGSNLDGASIPLLGPEGETVGHLHWMPDQPGYELLRLLLPPLSISVVVLIAFAWLVVANARKSTSALQDSARTVQAYAQTLQESEARFRDVAEASSDWIWECDPDLRLIYFSSRFSEVTGVSAASVLGKTLEQFFSSDSESDGWARLLAGTHNQLSFRDLRCRYRDANGHTRICRLAGRPILDHANTFIGYRGTATDITEEVEAQARANHLALHDALTELPNRVLFRERLDLALSGNRQNAGKVAMLCLDLDHFKEVNDTLGHGAGDVLLKMVAERLQTCVRPADTVARLGGDEFAIIQVDITDPAEAEAMSRRIVEVVKEPFRIDGQEIYVSVSIGVALPEAAGHDPERLLKAADIALYRAKQAGRSTVRFFETQMDMELQARKTLEYDLRQAMLKNELELHYQPLIELKSERIAAVEALARWNHPVRGAVPPNEFIRLAEETGLIVEIGEWVLRTACAQALKWPGIRMAVNLSPVQFRHKDLVNTVREVLRDTGLEAERLELEITESVLINDTDAALEMLSALKALGVNIAMDDFGTGYSSLAYLNAFPFDKIKIDRSFISHLSEQNKSNAIVKSVLSLGLGLDIVTTAEGVETMEQVAFLLEEGCGQVQGFYFGRPVPAKKFTSFIKNWKGFGQAGSSDAAA